MEKQVLKAAKALEKQVIYLFFKLCINLMILIMNLSYFKFLNLYYIFFKFCNVYNFLIN